MFALYPFPQRHFCVFSMSFPGAEALSSIYSSILSQHLGGESFSSALQRSSSTLVQLALALHQRVSSTFFPTAVKFHYIFNLRDLSNIFQQYTKADQVQLASPPEILLMRIGCGAGDNTSVRHRLLDDSAQRRRLSGCITVPCFILCSTYHRMHLDCADFCPNASSMPL
ncbi:hypothetical protein GOODEAATRI_015115 [Goodea atripinnis]|uniref:Dynein heavy chain 3 AAA+ lid domain-containing protein n=1 Tax=Goodea atripinnis TaxID=208336 RepID=A0ABV0P574_9TELE